MDARFGIAIPQVFLNGCADMTLVTQTLQHAEKLGYESAWVQDQIIGDTALMESVSLLCYAAAVTEKLKLGVSVIVFPTRNAVQLAKSFSTLDHLSGGRAILGIGLGPPVTAENFYKSFGADYSQRLRRFTEGLEVMRSLWQNETTSIDGEFYQLNGTRMQPKPLQDTLPVWFGGQHPDAIKRAAAHANGFMGAGPTPTWEFAQHVQQLRAAMGELGRAQSECPVSKRVYLALDDDADRAKARLDAFFEERYPWQIARDPNFVANICCWGSAQQVATGLREVCDAGAEMIVLNPLWDYVEQYEQLAADVIPLLNSQCRL
ncbi:MAG: LLM class flavin-dependent oxidoreductase [Gammaproteobacteria bacterium]|nr:LLM class flavin-dependent oxidoreductase [Gammaproteobacteria bacterium]